jgi:DsbC/DsbD-like thiol-disulfide interchange protein
VPVLADFARRRHITFPLLSDAGSATIKAYGILNTTVPESDRERYGIPFPGTFFVDRRGVVTSRFFETAYQERNTIASVMIRLGDKVDAPATRLSTDYLELTAYSSDQIAAPGTHFSLVVDIRPKKDVHVYAPGVTGYKPVALSIQPQRGLVLRAAQFPKPEDYFFKPLNEHVLVYQRPFKIVQDVMIDPSPEAAAALKDVANLDITGTLAFQACDDKICFTPQSVPLTWKIALKPLDRERYKRD